MKVLEKRNGLTFRVVVFVITAYLASQGGILALALTKAGEGVIISQSQCRAY